MKAINGPKYWTASELMIEEAKASERTFFRFWVIADGEGRGFNRLEALNKHLSTIYSTPPKVFRNASKGITFDFDA